MSGHSEREYAAEVADWCERELKVAKETGNLETRPFVQNAQLIVDALRAYSVAGVVSSGQNIASIKDMLRTPEGRAQLREADKA
jgi:hypothetical protein